MDKKDKKKILYLITKSNWGGAQKYVYDLATNLPKDKFTQVVVSGGTGSKDSEEGLLLKKLKEKDIRTIFIKSFTRDIFFINEFKSFWLIYKLIKKERPNIVHLNSSKAAGIGALASRLLGINKIIYTVHGWPFVEKINFLNRLLRIILSFFTAHLATDLITINKQDYKKSRFLLIPQKKLHLIYNGIKNNDFYTKEEAIKNINDLTKRNIDVNKTIIGTIAELHPNKNLSTLIKAFKESLASYLIIIGEGEDRESLEFLISKNNLEDKVILTGFIPEASKLLKAFNLFILPSHKEGHPYVILEAGSANIPVIGNDIPGIRDLLYPNNGILINVNKENLLTKKIDELLNNKNLKNELATNLNKKVKEYYSLETTLNKTFDLY